MPISGNFNSSPIHKNILLKWLPILVGAVVVIWFGYLLVGERILKEAAHQQLEKLTSLSFEIENLSFGFPANITMRSLRGSSNDSSFSKKDVITASKLEAKFSVTSLFLLSPRLKSLKIDDFTFNLERNKSGHWNVPLPSLTKKKTSKKLPKISLTNGMVSVSRFDGTDSISTISLPVEIFSFHQFGDKKNYNFVFNSAKTGLFCGTKCAGSFTLGDRTKVVIDGNFYNTGCPILENQWQINNMHLGMLLDSQGFSIEKLTADIGDKTKLEFTGDFNFVKANALKNCKLDIYDAVISNEKKINTFYYGPKLRELSGEHVRKIYDQYNVSGLCDISFSFNTEETKDILGGWKCLINWKDAKAAYYKFPYELEHLSGDAYIDLKRVHIDKLIGHHGKNDVTISVESLCGEKFPDDWNFNLDIDCKRAVIDDDIYAALTAREKKIWLMFAPTGDIGVDFNLKNTPKLGKTFTLNLRAIDVNASYSEFPYPLKNITGDIVITPKEVFLKNLLSSNGDMKLVANGNVILKEEPSYNILVKADNFPIDATLRSCLEDRFRSLYDKISLENAKGSATIKIFNNTDSKSKVGYEIITKVRANKMQYSGFPTSLSNVLAQIELLPGEANIKFLTGDIKGGGKLEINGNLSLLKDSSYDLSFRADQFSFTKDMMSNLPDKVASFLEQLNFVGTSSIKGSIDGSANSAINYDIDFDLNDDQLTLKGLEFNKLNGKINIKNDSLKLDGLRGMLKQEALGTDASFNIDGLFSLDNYKLKKGKYSLYAKNLSLDAGVIHLIKLSSLAILDRLSPRGLIGVWLDGYLDNTSDILDNRFDLQLSTKNASLFKDGVISGINGLFKGNGRFSDKLQYLRGSLDIDKLNLYSLLCEDLKSEIVYKEDMGLATARDLRAKIAGGNLIAGGRVAKNAKGDWVYTYRVELKNVDSSKLSNPFLKEKEQGREKISGSANLKYSAQGEIGDRESLRGRVNLSIDDVSFAQSSLSAKIVKEVVKEAMPQYKFDRMSVDAYVLGDRVVVQDMYLVGNNVSFRGGGDLNLKKHSIDLKLTAHSRDILLEPGMGESLVNALGGSIANITIKGGFSEPEVKVTMLGLTKKK